MPAVAAGSDVGEIVTTASSLRIVPVAVARAMVALLAADRVTVNVSSGSTVVSPMIVTAMLCTVVPGAKASGPEVAT
ncbi:hypothetical protein NB689_001430 [Xanthomonas sacchari]|nr:hypothetical protein [Xanthomonas sacchari]MCW0449082.1 hypothetical protein [Xanthomonas sacchari]